MLGTTFGILGMGLGVCVAVWTSLTSPFGIHWPFLLQSLPAHFTLGAAIGVMVAFALVLRGHTRRIPAFATACGAALGALAGVSRWGSSLLDQPFAILWPMSVLGAWGLILGFSVMLISRDHKSRPPQATSVKEGRGRLRERVSAWLRASVSRTPAGSLPRHAPASGERSDRSGGIRSFTEER